MPRLGFALPGAAALAFGVLTATTVFAQQPHAGKDTQASPAQERSMPPGREDDERVDRGDRETRGDRDRDWRDDRHRRWSDRDRRDFDERDDNDRWERRWDHERPMMRRGDRDHYRGWRDGDGERRMGWHHHHHGRMSMMRALRGLCGPRGERIVAFMLDRLERVTQPTDAQQPAFDKLKDAVAKARDSIKEACPTGARPVTPPGRLAAAEKRLEALLAAVRTVRGPLEEYYGSLSEEQKARLYMSHGRGWHRGFDRWRDRDRDWQRRDRDNDREGMRERRREGSSDRDEDRGSNDARRRHDRNRDGWPDDWRGRS